MTLVLALCILADPLNLIPLAWLKQDKNQAIDLLMKDALFKAAITAMELAHCPYSQFPVGAAILCGQRIFSGCNIENVSFPQGCCAETTAIGQMIMGGAKQIDAVAVIAKRMPLITPCGGCRQQLSEFSTASTKIHLCNLEGVQRTVLLGDLLPYAFNDQALDHLKTEQ